MLTTLNSLAVPYPKIFTLSWKPYLTVNRTLKMDDSKETSTEWWKKQKQCSFEQNRNCSVFPSTPFNLTIYSPADSVKSRSVLPDSILPMQNFIHKKKKKTHKNLPHPITTSFTDSVREFFCFFLAMLQLSVSLHWIFFLILFFF